MKLIETNQVETIINATPDHWGGLWFSNADKGKATCLCRKTLQSRNMEENEMLVEEARKFNKVVQVGDQQAS